MTENILKPVSMRIIINTSLIILFTRLPSETVTDLKPYWIDFFFARVLSDNSGYSTKPIYLFKHTRIFLCSQLAKSYTKVGGKICLPVAYEWLRLESTGFRPRHWYPYFSIFSQNVDKLICDLSQYLGKYLSL